MEPIPPAVAHHVEVRQLDGTDGLDHHGGVAPDALEPPSDLCGVGDGGREAHESDMIREVDDDLLPDRSAVGVLEVVDLVEDHHREVVEGP
ncbi:MAG: hypothetical protein GWN79_12700, partial [Actinobacteria bacterium]|nr:hypothetical protein [Actinomycetota bacterium]NIS32334.1 hypothetical protein [Actinomycetota bacterium]NIT96208.1 hypothetical protein [Actinomycetota bacterium]NIU19897.1 hypothetical protein [Actinomycetota bacterium]NIU67366.1 hypothetical protein [Actinomycetota bacterium]